MSTITTSEKLADLLDEITNLIRHYIVLPDPLLAVLIAYWIANTYTYKHFQYCGYLALRSATPQCGKSRLLRLIGYLSKGAPKPIALPTAAVLFRTKGEVLLLDEVDALGNRDKRTHGDLIGVLNAGFERGGTVSRMEKRFGKKKESYEPVEYSVYGPKALAGIESLADTLADRAFQIQMRRSPVKLERLNERKLEETFEGLRRGLETWAEEHGNDIETAYDALPCSIPELADLDDRFQNIAEPLVVLASLAEKERPLGELVLPRLYAGLRVTAGRREVSWRERSLAAILEIAERLLRNEAKVFVSTEDFLAKCQGHLDLSNLENERGLAGLLKLFELFPSSNGKKRGYVLTTQWVSDWQSRYQPRTDGFDGFDGKMKSNESASLFSSTTTYSTNPPLTPLSEMVSNLSVVSADQGEDDLDDEF